MSSPSESPRPSTATISITRAVWALALPVLAEELLNYLVGTTDWLLAGRFIEGDDSKAAMGLMVYVLWILPTLFSFIAIGTTAVVARHVGADELSMARRATSQALLMGFAWAMLVMLVCFLGGGWFIHAVQLRGEAARLAGSYLWIVSFSIPAIMLEQIGTAALRGAGDTITGLIARVVVNLVNMVLSAALVTGYGPFPQLGWEGLAVGTFVGHIIGGLIIVIALWRPACVLNQREGVFQYDQHMAWRILRIGIPGGTDACSIILCHLVYFSIIGRVGVSAVAAHGLGLQIESLSYLPGTAFQVAAATLAGQSLGADNPRRAWLSVATCCFWGMVVMGIASITYYHFGENIAEFYLGRSDATTILTGRLMKIVAIACPCLAAVMVFSGALRGAGDTRFPLLFTWMGLLGVRIPLACYLAWKEVPLPFLGIVIAGQDLGVIGAWWAMVTDVAIRSTLLGTRFLQGGWLKTKV